MPLLSHSLTYPSPIPYPSFPEGETPAEILKKINDGDITIPEYDVPYNNAV